VPFWAPLGFSRVRRSPFFLPPFPGGYTAVLPGPHFTLVYLPKPHWRRALVLRGVPGFLSFRLSFGDFFLLVGQYSRGPNALFPESRQQEVFLC